MSTNIPKIGDILITTEKYFEINGDHAIYEVVYTDTVCFIMKKIMSTMPDRIGDEVIKPNNNWSTLYTNIS